MPGPHVRILSQATLMEVKGKGYSSKGWAPEPLPPLCRRFFFTYLLPHSAPPSLRPLLDSIVNATGKPQDPSALRHLPLPYQEWGQKCPWDMQGLGPIIF